MSPETPVAPSPAPADPHASRVALDDPRLHVARARARTLRKGPAVAVAAGLLGATTLALALALRPAAAPPPAKPEADAPTTTGAPAVPDAIRHAEVSGPRGRPPASRRNERSGTAQARQAAAPERDDPSSLASEEDRRALGAAVFFDLHSTGEDRAGASSPPLAPAASSALGATGHSAPAASDDPNRQAQKNRFLEGASNGTDSVAATVEHPQSPYELEAGTIVPAVLLTGIDSDLPGPVLAQVRENVYDTVTGNFLLIPQGARLLAEYDSTIVWGQDRVLVCWNRLLFPNGDSIDLHCMPAADLEGKAGLSDRVDEHWTRLVAGAGLSSLLAATAQGAAGNTTGFSPTVPQLWAGGGAQSVNQSGQSIIRRDLMVQPTITVRPGFSINVILNRDLVLPPYRENAQPFGSAPGAPDPFGAAASFAVP